MWLHARRHVGLANTRLEIIDLEHGRSADGRRRGQLDRLQRRDLQLPRAPPASSASTFRTHFGHRGHPACLPALGRGRARATPRHVRLRALGRGAQRSFCARDRFGIKPLYYSARRRRLLLRVRGEGAAAVPAEHRDRPRRLCGLPDVSVLARRQDAVRRHPRAAARPLPRACGRARSRAAATGRCTTSPTSTTPSSTSIERLRELGGRLGRAAPARRRAGRRVPQRRARLEHRRNARRGSELGRPASWLHRPVRRRPGVRREPLRAGRGAARAASTCTRSTIGAEDFVADIGGVVYHLDYPGCRARLVPAVHRLACWPPGERKVVLGGQGGDEIFGGYARYLIAYFEQCIKAAIDGTMHRGTFIVTYESIIPNLESPARVQAADPGVLAGRAVRGSRRALLPTGQPRACRRAARSTGSIFGDYSPLETFPSIFQRRQRRQGVVLRPDDALRLQDAAARAAPGRGPGEHGARPRVADGRSSITRSSSSLRRSRRSSSSRDGELKHSLRLALGDVVPPSISERKDKMGVPVPLTEWVRGPLRDYVLDTFAGPVATISSRASPSNGSWRRRRASADRSGGCSRSSSGSRATTTARVTGESCSGA